MKIDNPPWKLYTLKRLPSLKLSGLGGNWVAGISKEDLAIRPQGLKPEMSQCGK